MKMLGLAGISGSGLRNEALMAICSEERSYWFRLTFAFHRIGVSTAGFCQVDKACIEAEISVAEIGCSQVFSRNFAAQSLQVPAPVVPRSRKSRDLGHPIWYVGPELGHPPRVWFCGRRGWATSRNAREVAHPLVLLCRRSKARLALCLCR
jgi:hypothetical protein